MDPNATLNILLDEARRLLSFLDGRPEVPSRDDNDIEYVADAAEALADVWRKEK